MIPLFRARQGRLAAHRAMAAFTLIEILVVITIIAVLAALIFPTIGSAIRNGQQTTSMSNLRQWAAGFSAAIAEADGDMPSDGNTPSFSADDSAAWFNRIPKALQMKPYSLLSGDDKPRVGQKSIWVNPVVKSDEAGSPLFCYGYNDYLSSAATPTIKASQVQNPSRTVLMAEKDPKDGRASCGPENITAFWGPGRSNKSDPEAVANILFCDGHVESVKRQDYMNTSATTGSEDDLRNARLTFLPNEKAER